MLKALTAKAIAEAKLEQLEAMDETVSSVGFPLHATATDWFCSPLKKQCAFRALLQQRSLYNFCHIGGCAKRVGRAGIPLSELDGGG